MSAGRIVIRRNHPGKTLRIRNDYTKSEEILDDEIDFIATVSDALAHPARIRMLRFIMDCNKAAVPVCNKDLAANFGYAQSTISQHMKTLTRSGLVDIRKADRKTFYYVNIGLLSQYVNTARKI